MAEDIRIGALHLRFLRTRHGTNGALDMFEMTVPAQTRVPAPHHHRDWEETICGLSGVLTFTIDGQTVALGPGDTAFIPRGVIHGFANDGAEPATCLTVLTPGVLGPEYFRELAAAIGGGAPPDPARIREITDRHGLMPVPLPGA